MEKILFLNCRWRNLWKALFHAAFEVSIFCFASEVQHVCCAMRVPKEQVYAVLGSEYNS